MGQGESAPSPERLRAIALNRLKALGIPAWVSHGWARGRMVIKPERFKPYANVQLEPEQDFVVYQHAFLAFPTPSPLQHLGGVRFYEEENAQSLHVSIERRWAALIAGTETALARARGFCPESKLDPASWTIEHTIVDRNGRVVFRFDGRLAIIYAYSVDGNIIQYGQDVPPIGIQLPEEPLYMDDRMFSHCVQEARRRMGKPAFDDGGRISLDLASVDLQAFKKEASISATPKAASAELDLDLERLKTGDLKVYPSEDIGAVGIEAAPTSLPAKRRTREPQSVPAKLRWDGGEIDVVLADISAGGTFARTSTSNPPRAGQSVLLSGFGKLAVAGQVAFVRPREEANLFATGSGVGIQFMIDPLSSSWRSFQEAPACAVFLQSPELRKSALFAIDEARALPWTADSLTELAVITLHVDIKLVVIDEAMSAKIEASLGFEERGIAVLPVRGAHELDAARIKKRLPTRT